ncbi:MAG: protein kinase, partial [Thermoanaerobaculia bacterium]
MNAAVSGWILMIGKTLSHFHVTAKLGAGGMGEVYRAEDTKLGRAVAIKVLPEAVATNPERLARFEREAKVLAALNHPHIAGIYSLEAAEMAGEAAETAGESAETAGTEAGRFREGATVHFLVMELAEGEDLAQRLARGPLPLDQALPLALQIAEAMEAAHERGIIHRDLKPANVMVAPDGLIKVLDFGLAKALQPESDSNADLSMSPTLTAQMTQVGVLLGTAAYMSPEQAAGEVADRRSDIWAFGLLLAEMLTGRRQFEGKSVSHVLAAVLKDEPDLGRLGDEVPAGIVELIERCLRKEPKQRLQSIGDARVLLQELASEPATSARPAQPRDAGSSVNWSRALPWALFGLATAGLVVALWMMNAESPAANAVLKAAILPPENTSFYLAGWNPGPAVVSPDGSKLAFSAQEDSGVVRLYVQALDADRAQALPGTESAAYPFWSPDSRWVGFFTDVDQTLKKIDTAGGPPITVCEAENGKGGSWSRDGVILFSPRSDTPIHQVSMDGGEPTAVTSITVGRHNSHRHPRFLPDGRHFLYQARGDSDSESAVMVGSLDDGSSRELVASSTQAEYASDRLLFTRGDTLMAQPFDPDRLELSGEAAPLAEKILTVTGAALAIFSASEPGLLTYQAGGLDPGVTLEWRDRQGASLGTLGEKAIFGPITLSPDGQQVASVIFDSGGLGDIWLTEVETGLRTRFTFDTPSDIGLAWAPNSEDLILGTRRGASFAIHRQAVGGVGEKELLYESEQDKILCSVSPDGQSALFFSSTKGTNRDLWSWSLE